MQFTVLVMMTSVSPLYIEHTEQLTQQQRARSPADVRTQMILELERYLETQLGECHER